MSDAKHSAEWWITHLGLVAHPGEEDGYFAVPFQSEARVVEVVSSGRQEERAAASIAYFLQKFAGRPGPETMFFQCRS